MPYYMLLIIVFTVHPVVVAEPVNAILLPDIITPNTNPVDVPNDDADTSLKLTLLPLYIAIILPALPTDPDLIL
jgi:hypothetical protein